MADKQSARVLLPDELCEQDAVGCAKILLPDAHILLPDEHEQDDVPFISDSEEDIFPPLKPQDWSGCRTGQV